MIGSSIGPYQVLDALELALEALVDVHLCLFVVARQPRLALAGDAQHPAVEVDFHRGRIQARGENVELQSLRRAADVERRKAAAAKPADAGEDVEGPLNFALQAAQLGQDIARKQRPVHRSFSLPFTDWQPAKRAGYRTTRPPTRA